MAHTCFECGQVCYCNGDIDDCIFDNTHEQNTCTHCPVDGVDDDDCGDAYEAYDDDPERLR